MLILGKMEKMLKNTGPSTVSHPTNISVNEPTIPNIGENKRMFKTTNHQPDKDSTEVQIVDDVWTAVRS